MPNLPSQLTWALTQRNSCFVTKRDQSQFSRHPQNLANLNTYKYSGLANNKAVGVNVADKAGDEDFDQITLTVKTKKGSSATALRRNPGRSAKIIKKATSGSYYRRDLSRAALARFTRLQKSLNAKASGVVKTTRSKTRFGGRKLKKSRN